MYKKSIFFGVLVAFLSAQFVSSLTCYECYSPSECKKATKVTCTDYRANRTSDHLGILHLNVPEVRTSPRFDCLRLVYQNQNNSTVIGQIQGCVHPTVNACGLSLKPTYQSQHWNRNCKICSGDKCNKNPAGTLSGSFYTIIVATLGLVITKTYA